jgi:hypothetical protein
MPLTPKRTRAAFGFSGAEADDAGRPAYPKVRVVTVSECASHVVAGAAIGGVAGKGAGEQSLARTLYRRLDEDWLLIADRNFYGWADWCTASDSGAALLWRVKADLTLPLLELLPDGSYTSVLVSPKIRGKARQTILEAARADQDLDQDKARYVRVVDYEIPDREGDGKGEVIALVTTITEMTAAPAPLLAEAYAQRREHETRNKQLKTYLRGPGKVLRSKSPDMVRQEIYGYLLTHYAISALICRAATEAGIDPTGSSSSAPCASSAAGPPTRRPFPLTSKNASSPKVMADITRTKRLNPRRRHRTYPRVVKLARHNSYRVKRPGDHGTRHPGPPRSSWSITAMAPPRSAWLTTATSHSQHDQLRLSGIGSGGQR